VQSTLSRLKREKEELEQKEVREFEAQDKKLWSSIEGAITAAEEGARKRAKEEADRIAAARKTQEEAEKKAKAAREEQEKKAREEKEANEQRTQKEQEKKKAEEEKNKAAQQAKEEAAKTREAMKGFPVGDALHDQSRQDYQLWSEKMKVSNYSNTSETTTGSLPYTYLCSASQHVKEKVLPVIAGNADWRKQCFAAKRQITPKIGQLTNSKEEIWRIVSLIGSQRWIRD
jgi:nucleoporin GLE1